MMTSQAAVASAKTCSVVDLYVTAREGGKRLHHLQAETTDKVIDLNLPMVRVDGRVRYQEIVGFGGAFTEAAASVFLKLPEQVRQQVLTAYFDPVAGHGYSLCRTHINSCDFALGNYAYDEVPGDGELKHFSIEHDRKLLIPMIKQAMAAAGGSIKLLASPWSPPAWMKSNGEMNHGGQLKPEWRNAWARYYCRYVKEYRKEGIDIWAMTVQNEPAANQTWDSCLYTAEEERDFVRDYLGPTLHREGLADVKLVVWDHNRDIMYERARVVYEDPEAAKYVWGTGFHWYCGDNFGNVQALHDAYPTKQLIFTEGCQEGGPHHGSWAVGERYGHSVINDLSRWTVGWIDWNLMLDYDGGPNHVRNLCSAPILADTREGTISLQSSYYYLGHFARFIRPGAQRILCASTRDALEATAAVNPDGRIAVVVMNRSEEAIEFRVAHQGRSVLATSTPHSIMTFVFAAE